MPRRPRFDDPDLPLSTLFGEWPDMVEVFLAKQMLCPGCPVAPFHAITDACVAAVAARAEPSVFILWGSHAQAKASRIAELNAPTRHCVIRSPHPSPLSAHRGFFGSKPFSRANAFLEKAGREPVDWRLG